MLKKENLSDDKEIIITDTIKTGEDKTKKEDEKDIHKQYRYLKPKRSRSFFFIK